MSDALDRLADAMLKCGLCREMIASRAMAEHIRECALREHPTTERFE